MSELWPRPDPNLDWEDDQDAIGDMLDDRDGDYDGFTAHWDERIADECPAGGRHTPVDNFTEADDSGRRISPGWHCDECGASLPTPERREP